MKKLSLIFSLLILAIPFYAQNKSIDELFDKYSGQEGFTSVNINGGLLTLASWMEDDKDTKDLIKDLNHVRILAMEDNSVKNVNFYKELIASIPVKDYVELMTVKEKDQDVKFLVKQSDGYINELLMIVGGKDNALISIIGKIDPKNLSKMTKIAKAGEHHEEN
jgi:hypothetical protein